MNYERAQREIFNAIVKGHRVRKFSVDADNVFISKDGTYGFIIPLCNLAVNLEKIEDFTAPISIYDVVKPENELTPTRDMRCNENRKDITQRFTGAGKNVFLNIKNLVYFQNPRFFQAGGPLSPVVVTEGNKSAIPVALVMPVRLTFGADQYYNDMEE